jgi:hypothetical protein
MPRIILVLLIGAAVFVPIIIKTAHFFGHFANIMAKVMP